MSQVIPLHGHFEDPFRTGVAADAPGASARRPLGTVILLEEDPIELQALERVLTFMCFRVRCFSCAESMFAAGEPGEASCLLIHAALKRTPAEDVHARVRMLGWRTPVIFVAAEPDVPCAVRAIRNGAIDFLLRDSPPTEWLKSVGEALEISAQLWKSCSEGEELRRRAGTMTPREREIVRLVVAGMLNKQIAERLNLALITVKVHRGSAMHKLGARNPAELTRIAQRVGLCDPSQPLR